MKAYCPDDFDRDFDPPDAPYLPCEWPGCYEMDGLSEVGGRVLCPDHVGAYLNELHLECMAAIAAIYEEVRDVGMPPPYWERQLAEIDRARERTDVRPVEVAA